MFFKINKYVIFILTGGVVNVNGLKLSPRIVLMTDGKPTGTSDAQVKICVLKF